jgi:hypothetical protein
MMGGPLLPLPHSRPARTLVLIFIVSSFESGRDWVRARRTRDRHGPLVFILVGCYGRLPQPPPSDRGVNGNGAWAAAAAVATGTNLGLDLHRGLL